MKLSVRLKTSPIPGQAYEVAYFFYPHVLEKIIPNVTATMDSSTV